LGVEVDGHRAPDVLVATVCKTRAPGGAGVVNEQVQAPVALADVLVDPLRRVICDEIDGHEAGALCTEFVGECAQSLGAASDEHE
jgi:hypothetical protein